MNTNAPPEFAVQKLADVKDCSGSVAKDVGQYEVEFETQELQDSELPSTQQLENKNSSNRSVLCMLVFNTGHMTRDLALWPGNSNVLELVMPSRPNVK